LKLAKTWINHCSKDHHKCKSVQGSTSQHPTRLVHVGSRSSPTLRLSVTTESAVHGPYTTLSHCWGYSVPFRLLRNTLEVMKTLIAAETLPKTFQDAIIVTRALDIEYIWIDSLCIIQDDVQDWRYESSRMCDEYYNSYCNIAATHSRDTTGGLFVDRDPSSVSCLLIRPKWRRTENRHFVAVLNSIQSILALKNRGRTT
jgi:hypothetical protein